jgi:hypothetical protein
VVQDTTRTYDLRFGDFDGDGTTDVFGVVNGGLFTSPTWQVRHGIKNNRVGLTAWQPLPVSLTTSVNGLMAADFDGDGRADIAANGADLFGQVNPTNWMISIDGSAGWTPYAINTSACAPEETTTLFFGAVFGHFAGNKGEDALLPSLANGFCVASGGNQDGQVGWTAGLSPYSLEDIPPYSLQDMR